MAQLMKNKIKRTTLEHTRSVLELNISANNLYIRSCTYILSHLITSSCLSCYFCWSNNFWDGKQHLFRLASLAKQSNVVFVRRNSNNIKELVVERFLKKAIIAKPLILPFTHFMNMTNNINHFNLNLFCNIAKNTHNYIFANILQPHNQSFQTNWKQRENCK